MLGFFKRYACGCRFIWLSEWLFRFQCYGYNEAGNLLVNIDFVLSWWWCVAFRFVSAVLRYVVVAVRGLKWCYVLKSGTPAAGFFSHPKNATYSSSTSYIRDIIVLMVSYNATTISYNMSYVKCASFFGCLGSPFAIIRASTATGFMVLLCSATLRVST